MKPYCLLIPGCVAAILCAALSAGDWPSFRGDGTSHVPAGEHPIHWPPNENIAWTADLVGYGQSAPVVANGTIYITAVEGLSKETNHLIALSAATGEPLWSQDGLTGNSIPSPVVVGDRVYVGARLGRQGGDVATVSRSNCCLRIRRNEAGFTVETGWKAEKVLSHYASPLIVGGSVYYVNNVGVLFRLDAETGQLIDRVRSERPCWATPVSVEDLVYLFGDDGTTTIFETTPKLTVIVTNRLWDDATAPAGDFDAVGFEMDGETPPEKSGGDHSGGDAAGTATPTDLEEDRPTVYGVAAAGGAFFVRTGTRLYCTRQR